MTKICVVGLDGVRLRTALENSPTVKALAERGSLVEFEMEPPTWSGPGWSSLLTGSKLDQHRVYGNSFSGHQLRRHPDLLSRAYYKNQNITTFAAAGWGPLVDPAGPGPVIQTRLEQQQAGQHRVVVRDGETYGYQFTDVEITRWAEQALELGVDVSFLHLCGVDEAGHLYGSVGDEYRDAMVRVGKQLGSLVSVIESRASRHDEDWLLVVTTDHGHRDEGGHGEDSPEERASFAIAARFGGPPVSWPEPFGPHQLVEFLLEFVPGG